MIKKFLIVICMFTFFLGVSEGINKVRMGFMQYEDDIVKYEKKETFLISEFLPSLRKPALVEKMSVKSEDTEE